MIIQNIRKRQATPKTEKPRWQGTKHMVRRSLMKQPSSTSTGDNESPERIKTRAKISIQTIMMAKSSYVEKLSTCQLT